MAKVKITYWKNIPVSLMVKENRENKANIQLPEIYMATVDAIATQTGETSTVDYTAGFRFEEFEQDCHGKALILAQTIAEKLVGKYPKKWLLKQRDDVRNEAASKSNVKLKHTMSKN